MIKVNKSKKIPAILATTGKNKRLALEQAFLSNPTSFNPEIKDTYNDKSVKKQLIKDQHDKCCFCESKISHISHGDVEHYRPKAGRRSFKNETLVKPGYYWLAYDWDNLFFACEICNEIFKENLFPLENEVFRARNHTHSIAQESPLLLNPYLENPENHITFAEEIPVGLTEKGERTIEIAGLDRSELTNRRRAYIKIVKIFLEIISLNRNQTNVGLQIIVLEIEAKLKDYTSASGEYAAMTRAYLQKENIQL